MCKAACEIMIVAAQLCVRVMTPHVDRADDPTRPRSTSRPGTLRSNRFPFVNTISSSALFTVLTIFPIHRFDNFPSDWCHHFPL
jgi:hypothetical protein